MITLHKVLADKVYVSPIFFNYMRMLSFSLNMFLRVQEYLAVTANLRLVQDKGSGGPLAPNFNKRSFQVNFLAPNDHPNLYLEQALFRRQSHCSTSVS